MGKRHSRTYGYTLIEVLIVVTIMGAVAAIVVPSMLEPGTLTTQAAVRLVVADILFAQNDAIARQAQRRVTYNLTDSSYRVTDADGSILEAPDRTGGEYAVSLATDSRFEGIEISAVNFSDTATLIFDEMGSPTSGGLVELRSGDTLYRVTVAPFTGRITVTQP